MRVGQYPGLENVFEVICFRAVEPRRRGRILNPRMIWASVIDDLVLNDLDAHAMRGSDELFQFGERAEMFFNGIEILRVVTVKAGARLTFFQLDLVKAIVVVIPGREPDGGDAEVVSLWEAIAPALKIAAVIVELVVWIGEPARLRRIIIGPIAVTEPIDHNQVQHVVRRETLKPPLSLQGWKNFE